MGMYVVQVMGGREQRAAHLIEKLAGDVVDECFIPLYEVMKRRHGSWSRTCERLFPGYLFVVTDNPAAAALKLRAMPLFMRLLTQQSDLFVPLSTQEIAWLQAFTSAKTHVVELSWGIIEGDTVMVVEGPLKGHEGLISKIDRHKRLAYLDMRMFGRTKTVRVGLEIVSKQGQPSHQYRE